MWLPHILAAVKETERLAWVDFKARASYFHPDCTGWNSVTWSSQTAREAGKWRQPMGPGRGNRGLSG